RAFQHMDASPAGFSTRASSATPVPLAQREQVILPLPSHGRKALEARVPLLEWKRDPPAAFVVGTLIALVDQGLVFAVGVFLRLYKEIKTARVFAEGDVFVSFAFTPASEPRMLRRPRLQAAMNSRNPPHVVEDDVVWRAFAHNP